MKEVFKDTKIKMFYAWTSLVAQWINLPANAGHMGSIPEFRRIPCHGATKPMHHNY